jgi:GTP-binding protein
VGKSTLFNRLAGRRIAIVSDVPGTTRDRVSIDAEWLGRRFMLVDTGGIEESPGPTTAGTPAELWRHVREQTQRALEQADGVVLVVDATTGLVPQDKDAAEMVRRSGKPCVIAVNKADTPQRSQAAPEFYALGLGEPFAISAYHGIDVGDAIEALLAKVSSRAEEAEAGHVPRVAIVGRPNVGKSALFNALTGQERAIVSPVPGTTRDSVDTLVKYGGRDLVFIDTAGLRRRGRVQEDLEKYSALRSLHSIERCHVAILILEVTQFVTDQDTHVAGYVDQAGRAAVIVVNKWDLASKTGVSQAEAISRVRDRFKFMPDVPVLFTSATTGRGVEKIPLAVFRVYEEFTRELPQIELSAALADAVSRRPPPLVHNRRVRISEVSQTRRAPPTLTFRTNGPELIHFSYRRYLENRLREAFGFTGSPMKLEFVSEEK